MTKFLFQKGNTYAKGHKRGKVTLQERQKTSVRAKAMWISNRAEMIAKVRAGMAHPEVRAKLRVLNARPRKKWDDAKRAKKSDELVGREPKNLWASLFQQNKYHSKHGWIEIGGQRHFMKSIWERNYARYLEWLKQRGEISAWDYEPKVFLFEKIQFGNRTYKPDFLVTENDGRHIWHEVKGFMTDASRVKLKRMAQYFPLEKILLIDESQYRALSQQLRHLIAGWEVDRNTARHFRTHGTYAVQ